MIHLRINRLKKLKKATKERITQTIPKRYGSNWILLRTCINLIYYTIKYHDANHFDLGLIASG